MPGISKALQSIGGEAKRLRQFEDVMGRLKDVPPLEVDFSEALLGDAPVKEVEGFQLPHSSLGTPESFAVSEVTPREVLANVVDDPEHADRVIERLAERNQGQGRAFDATNFERNVDEPITVFRGIGEVEGAKPGVRGEFNRSLRTASWPMPNDDIRGPGRLDDINTGEHEALGHALLHGGTMDDAPDIRLGSLGARNEALGGGLMNDFGEAHPNLDLKDPNAIDQLMYFSEDQKELANLLFHYKRLAELVHGDDFGVDRAASDRLGKMTVNDPIQFENGMYVDPQFDYGGFRDGEVAQGFERMRDYIRNLYRTSGSGGRRMIRDMMHRLGVVGAAATVIPEDEESLLGGLSDG